MKRPSYLVGIDAGTTGSTVMIIDLDGEVVSTAYREYPCSYPHPGWVEQDIDLVWKKVCEASREAVGKSGVDPHQILSIGVSSQRGTFVCVDEETKPLHHSIVWNDTRASSQAVKIARIFGEGEYHRITGMPVSALWAAPKIMWLLENEPGIIDRTFRIINGQEYLLHRLGASGLHSDPSSLTLNGMMDIDKLDWSGDIIAAMGANPALFPPMVTPASHEGIVSAEAAERTGFSPGTPVCRGGGDQQCAAVGAGVVAEGMAEITVGTAAMMVAHIDKRPRDPEKTAYIGGHALPGKWDMEGGAFATGACLRWWRDTYAWQESEKARRTGEDVYDLLVREAAGAPAGCRGYLFFPFMNGQVTPTYDNQARGGSLGLTLAHDRPTMIRAVLEGTAFELRMVVEALEGVLTRPFDTLRVTGGGAKSELWVQIQSDIFGRPIETLKVPECTTFGAAILGGVGAGVFSGIEEAVDVLVHTSSTVDPAPEKYEMYNELFGVFRDAYQALREAGIYERLSAIQDRM